MLATRLPAHVERFRADLEALTGPLDSDARIGIAVSGGPDSLALLLLAHAAYPGSVSAATVDHRLRAEAADEARGVASLCATLRIRHDILSVDVERGRDGLQAAARDRRYDSLADWCAHSAVRWLLTAHHADDQAETLLMRLARGAGVGGLAGVREFRPLTASVTLVRPLLGWRKAELVEIAEAAGLTPSDDPSNHDPRFDRTAARRLLADSILDPIRIANSARHLADAEQALGWATKNALESRRTRDGADTCLDIAGLPPEIVRRMLLSVFAENGAAPDGPSLDRLIARLRAGHTSTLASIKAIPGPVWRFSPAPPRSPSTKTSS